MRGYTNPSFKRKILQKLLQTYKTSPDICSAILTFILEGEQGLDMDGVKREVFTLFWEMPFEKFFEGHTTLVARVGPDIQDSNYQAIGRAMSHSYLLTGIFPITISKVSWPPCWLVKMFCLQRTTYLAFWITFQYTIPCS